MSRNAAMSVTNCWLHVLKLGINDINLPKLTMVERLELISTLEKLRAPLCYRIQHKINEDNLCDISTSGFLSMQSYVHKFLFDAWRSVLLPVNLLLKIHPSCIFFGVNETNAYIRIGSSQNKTVIYDKSINCVWQPTADFDMVSGFTVTNFIDSAIYRAKKENNVEILEQLLQHPEVEGEKLVAIAKENSIQCSNFHNNSINACGEISSQTNNININEENVQHSANEKNNETISNLPSACKTYTFNFF